MIFAHKIWGAVVRGLSKHYSVFFKVKQLNPKIPAAAAPHPEPSEYMCLVRFSQNAAIFVIFAIFVTVGIQYSCFRAVFKNEKISTVIHSKEVKISINASKFHNLMFLGEQIPAGLLQPVEVQHGRVEATKETENEESHSVVAVLDLIPWFLCRHL